MFGLIFLRQFLSAVGRLWLILAKSRPWKGFPSLRAFLDLLERIAHDPSPENVGPPLVTFLETIEQLCPGVIDAVLRPGTAGHWSDRDPLGPDARSEG
jgi:hypothetical protein